MGPKRHVCDMNYRLSDFEGFRTDGDDLFSPDAVEGFGGEEELLACLESLSEKLRQLHRRCVM
jgi:hypothetical protein